MMPGTRDIPAKYKKGETWKERVFFSNEFNIKGGKQKLFWVPNTVYLD